MHSRNWIAIASVVVLVMPLGATPVALSQEIRYFERNGITYREVLGYPAVAQISPSTQCLPVVYRPQFYTETRRVLQSYWVPITEYRWEARWVNRWNPFAEPYQEFRYVPVTRWEYRTDVAEIPVTCQRWVAEPVTTGSSSYAGLVSPGSSVVAVAGVPSTYAPRMAAYGVQTGPQVSASGWQPFSGGTSSASAWATEPAPKLASRFPPRQTSGLTSPGMVPIQVPAWTGNAGIGGIRRFEDELPRFGR